MEHSLNESFLRIANLILMENKSLDEWAQVESSDMFQEENYVGGFDATEMEFCFSVYVENREYWFQLSLKEIEKVAHREMNEVSCRLAE